MTTSKANITIARAIAAVDGRAVSRREAGVGAMPAMLATECAWSVQSRAPPSSE